MSDLYPLQLAPEFHERVWGMRDLSPIYAQQGEKPIGEVWLTGESCKVVNGPLAGQTLDAVAKKYGAELIGDAAPDATRFPLLIKFLFPREKLSVQVHPDDEGARAIGQACGKTECWYVLAARKGSQVGLGLKPGTTKDAVRKAIEEKRLEFLLNWIEVRVGDMIYVDAGTLHAIGPGAVLVEVQQNSDTTYRLYDYGRPRELHIEAGLSALKEKTHAGKVERKAQDKDGAMNLVSSPCFTVDKFSLHAAREFGPEGSEGGSLSSEKRAVNILIATEGMGVVEAEGHPEISFARGEVVVVPAAMERYRVRPQWQMECLRATLPAGTVEQPKTQLG